MWMFSFLSAGIGMYCNSLLLVCIYFVRFHYNIYVMAIMLSSKAQCVLQRFIINRRTLT